METLYIPTEDDFRKWIKEAVKECLKDILPKDIEASEATEPLLSRKEVAKKLRVSLVTLTDWVKHGLPSHKQRGEVYFFYSEVLEYIRRNRPRKHFEIAA